MDFVFRDTLVYKDPDAGFISKNYLKYSLGRMTPFTGLESVFITNKRMRSHFQIVQGTSAA